ncbi:hypothetical protein RND71_016901 [Anisodus tanguticus]|uniref:Uncharacterized protein n=1 Tax=Anisodus tanguticus TaxID=243964 RepID=A0AAE1VD91_9SOLA|nr:hypothetical protein RND71_016901 [Anisodus tanguticus]
MATSDNGDQPLPEDLVLEILPQLSVESFKNKTSKILIYDHAGCPARDDSPLSPNPITLISVSNAARTHENPEYLQEFRGMTYLLGSIDGLFMLERVIDCSMFNVSLALWNPDDREEHGKCSILSFDFHNEVFTEIGGPDAPRFKYWSVDMILLDDSIAILTEVDANVYDIWVMIQPGVWNKLLTFHCFQNFGYLRSWSPYTVFFRNKHSSLNSCDIRTQETRYLGFRHPRLMNYFDEDGCSIHHYKESLVTIKRGNGELDDCSLADIFDSSIVL